MKLDKDDWQFYKANHANLLVYFDRGEKATKVLTNAINDEIGIKYHYTKLRSGRFSRQEIEVPKIVLDYNMGTHGVDQRNQFVQSMHPLTRTRKWWKVIFQADLATACVNSYEIWKKMNDIDN